MNLSELKAYLINNVFPNGIYNSGKTIKYITPEIHQLLFSLTPNCSGTYLGERIYWIMNDINDYPIKCKTCNNSITTWGSYNRPYIKQYCSKECMNTSPKVKLNRKLSMLEKTGGLYDNPAKDPNNTIKASSTYLDKHGYNNPMQNPAIKEKRDLKFQKKTGVKNPSQLHHSPEKIEIKDSKDSFTRYYNELGRNEFKSFLGFCETIFLRKEVEYGLRKMTQSSYEIKIKELLTGHGVDFHHNKYSVLKDRQLDFYIPDHNLAIEIGSFYWHSELGGNKHMNYHLEKTEKCLELGIDLIQIHDDEYHDKWNIVESNILTRMGFGRTISADKCDIKEVSYSEGQSFLNDNHILGYYKSDICYGLYLSDELVSMASFTVEQDDGLVWDMVRYSPKINLNVINGLTRLFNHFIKIHDPNSVMVYSDRRWHESNFYENIGFNLLHSTKPSCYYTSNYRTLISESEWGNVDNTNCDRIWDCGNNVFKWLK